MRIRSSRDTYFSACAAQSNNARCGRTVAAAATAAFDGFRAIGRALGPFDLAALPIGAYEPVAMMKDSHLNPEEAAAASRELRSRRSLAIHYGTFDLSDEPIDEPPRRFLAAAEAAGVPAGNAWILKLGETRSF